MRGSSATTASSTPYPCRMPAENDHEGRAARPRQDDVARLAGVSAATVSFVLNETRGQKISPETRQRVLTAVAELDYRPNRTAQGLRRGRTATIGFVNHDAEFGAFAASAIEGAHEASVLHGNLMVVVNSGGSAQQAAHLIGDLLDRQVDALIYAVSGTKQIVVPDRARRVPTVLMNCFSREAVAPAILPDEVRGGREAAEALSISGTATSRTSPALSSALGDPGPAARLAPGAGAAGLDPRHPPCLSGTYQADSGYELARQLLRADPADRGHVRQRPDGGRRAAGDAGGGGTGTRGHLSDGVRRPAFQLAAEIHPALSTVRLPYTRWAGWPPSIFASAGPSC